MTSEGKPFASAPKKAEDELDDAVKAIQAAAKELEDNLNAASNLHKNLRTASDSDQSDANFTWEHFFTKHCGILREDALEYEAALIANRMDPLDTLLESFDLLIKYGRIPIGDKLKIKKTIERKEKDIESEAKAMEAAKKEVGLEKYNDFQASMIMGYATGDTEYHIDYAVEQFEDGMHELKRLASISLLKDPAATKAYNAGASMARLVNDPTFQFLSSFGYKTYEYTKGKSVANSKVPCYSASSDHVTTDILLGHIEDLKLTGNAPETMYS